MQEGWKCPECGRINAPWLASCDHVLPIAYPVHQSVPWPLRNYPSTGDPLPFPGSTITVWSNS